ncbi:MULTISPECIES: hypothetical protein [unclassified Prochlorococcus]|uniref:hypothetical protein n=1 Tax=unclassified Prochlorococcus TaxID=2627481 RepID=UPI000533A8CD|nr:MULTISPECIES: hypothetical protein [unclassified Prochlorococcus]KGG15233.1 putative protein family PM-1 [Prochlorococcus sp. MIT 0602]KGG17508.1 putative protein family PM-1 [Prochlorococcus sp. MIT 0603]
MATAKEKKEAVKTHLKHLRAELRTIHLAVTEELQLPEANNIKDLMTKMEELLTVIDPKKSKSKKKK